MIKFLLPKEVTEKNYPRGCGKWSEEKLKMVKIL